MSAGIFWANAPVAEITAAVHATANLLFEIIVLDFYMPSPSGDARARINN
jgi:hypothetical protein